VEIINELTFKNIIENNYVIKQCGNLPKVLYSHNNQIIKIFYPKSKYSSDNFKPYALRFCRNSIKLKCLNVTAPHVFKIQYYAERRIYILYYEKIMGEDLEVLIQSGKKDLFEKLAIFLALLHHNGINFRSIHLGNLVYQKEKDIALIDISSMKFKKNSLRLWQRYKNILNLVTMKKQRKLWSKNSITNFLTIYCANAKLSFFSQRVLTFFVKYHINKIY
jgi:hypothetical protein